MNKVREDIEPENGHHSMIAIDIKKKQGNQYNIEPKETAVGWRKTTGARKNWN